MATTPHRSYDSTVTTDPADAAESVYSRAVPQWRQCAQCSERIVAGRLCAACWAYQRGEFVTVAPQRRHSATAGSDGTTAPELHAAAWRTKYEGGS